MWTKNFMLTDFQIFCLVTSEIKYADKPTDFLPLRM
jgi:hypothetical protein